MKNPVAAIAAISLTVGFLQWFAAVMVGGTMGVFLICFLAAWAIPMAAALSQLQRALEREERQRRLKHYAIYKEEDTSGKENRT